MTEKLLISLLDKVVRNWDRGYQLFADNGTLCLVRLSDGLIVKEFVGISCDGGDPDHITDEEDNVYIVQGVIR